MIFEESVKKIEEFYEDSKKLRILKKEFFVELKKIEDSGNFKEAYMIYNHLQFRIKLSKRDIKEMKEIYNYHIELCKELIKK